MRKGFTIILSFLLALQLSAQSDGKQRLQKIFNEAEQCYLIDDYQQLESCLKTYADVFTANVYDLGDSIDVYSAYYYKMCGTYYYGFAEDDSCAYYSESFFRKSLGVFNQRDNTENTTVLHEELAQLYYKKHLYDQAKVQLNTVLDQYNYWLNDLHIDIYRPNYYKTLSQLAICNARLGNFDIALSQINESIDDYFKKQKEDEYYEALRKRGKILMLQADSLGSTHYKKAVDSYQQYVNERYASIYKEIERMSDSQREQYWLATHLFLYDCFRLGNRAPQMLYDLALFSKDFLVRRNPSKTKWEQVRQALGKKDCAIEFVQYFGKQDEKRIGCLVLKNNSKAPLFIDLFSTDSLLNLPLVNLRTIGSAISSTISTTKNALYLDQQLPLLIWSKSLMTAIGDANRVYFAPDGMLHQLAIEYLMPDSSKVCYRLSSTRNLIQKRTVYKMESALLLGGVEYNAEYQPNHRDNDVVAYRYMSPNSYAIKNLPGSKKEVDSIYATRHNPKDTLLVGTKATDETFLRLLRRHDDVIHLSTHGYFGGKIGINNDIKPLLNDESMSKSGLLFAGAVNTLADTNFDENMFDGVLSAAELSKQDLSHSELIVLSACQTGMGHLTDDGIYGIQRGLKLAGANTMILSLWSVNDHSSSMLMRFFYEELEKQSVKSIHSAFLTARQRLIQEEMPTWILDPSTLTNKKEIQRYNTPQHANPFIIIDAF